MTGCSCSHCCCCCFCSCSPLQQQQQCGIHSAASSALSALTWESFTLKSRSAFAAANNKKQSNKIGNDTHRFNVADKNGDDPMLILHKFLYSIQNFSISFKFRVRLRWRRRYAMPRRRARRDFLKGAEGKLCNVSLLSRLLPSLSFTSSASTKAIWNYLWELWIHTHKNTHTHIRPNTHGCTYIRSARIKVSPRWLSTSYAHVN